MWNEIQISIHYPLSIRQQITPPVYQPYSPHHSTIAMISLTVGLSYTCFASSSSTPGLNLIK